MRAPLRRFRYTVCAVAVGLLAVLTIALAPMAAIAQYMFLDMDGDGEATAEDVVQKNTTMTVDVWLQTNTRSNGSPAMVAPEDLSKLTFNSYEFILRAEGGKVVFGEYTNLQRNMRIALPSGRSDTEVHVGFAGTEILPPGKYRLGRLSVHVTEGNPQLVFAPSSSLDAIFLTSFGSGLSGADEDNTLKLSTTVGSAGQGMRVGPGIGDWTDTAGLRTAEAGLAAELPEDAEERLQFSASVRGNAQRGGVSFRVSTTKPGPLTIDLYDVRGRLIRRLVDEESAAPGVRDFAFASGVASGIRLAAGVYYYRVVAAEGRLKGSFVLVK